jgi:hypothetical protein
VTAALFERKLAAPLLVSLDDEAFFLLTIPASRGNSGRRSGATLQCRRCRVTWRGWFDTRLTGKNLRRLAINIQKRNIESVKPMPDKYGSLATDDVWIKTIEIKDKKEQG